MLTHYPEEWQMDPAGSKDSGDRLSDFYFLTNRPVPVYQSPVGEALVMGQYLFISLPIRVVLKFFMFALVPLADLYCPLADPQIHLICPKTS